MDAISITADSQLFVFTTPAVARSIATKTSQVGTAAFPNISLKGGPVGPFTLVISDGVPAAQMVFADVAQFAASGGVVVLDVTQQATIQMDSAPDSPPTAATNQVGLWQNDLSAFRAERIFGIERLRTASVAIIGSIAY
jgi:hypothetical protein